jgi:protoheme IX farnesyltransferase
MIVAAGRTLTIATGRHYSHVGAFHDRVIVQLLSRGNRSFHRHLCRRINQLTLTSSASSLSSSAVDNFWQRKKQQEDQRQPAIVRYVHSNSDSRRHESGIIAPLDDNLPSDNRDERITAGGNDSNIAANATKQTTAIAAAAAATTTTSTMKTKAYLELAKAKLSALVVTTTAAGFIAAGGPLSEQALLATCCVTGTALCSSSAAAWNQIFEVDRDSQMKRTQQRPLVTGLLTMTEAKTAATLWGVTGTTILALGTDPVTATLGLANVLLYSGIYTYMKPRSVYNTQVGGIVGAIPPLMGWTAATGGSILDLDAMILASTLYLWQMPHFFALSYMHRVDYKRGGFAMLPVLESDGEATSATILRNAVYLSAMPFVSTLTGVTSSMFALEGVALNSYALYVAYKFRQERTNANARKIFLTSLWYLPCWLTLFLLHSKVWDEEKDRDVLRDAISDTVHRVREQGKKLCIHEQVVAQNHDDDKCPIQLTKKGSEAVQEAASTAIQSGGTQKEM